MLCYTYYANPPHMPSRLISRKTVAILSPFESSWKNPTADSTARASRITPWKIAGRGNKAGGRGGSPIDIDDREKNTVVWYTS